MHRSSDTIGNISGALAKAQAELTNPEKSLVAIIRSPFPVKPTAPSAMPRCRAGWTLSARALAGMRSRLSNRPKSTKRPASFASRPSLRIRPENGSPRNGRFARSSDIASAQRMGAALTYARRYALFTLVGIAGEDDLDAPDLGADPNPAAELPRQADRRKQSNGQAAAAQRTADGDGNLPRPSARSVLGEQLSASLRESLIEQMAAINSADEAAAWAHRNLPAKNTLTAADAKMVEERFQARLSAICNGVALPRSLMV